MARGNRTLPDAVVVAAAAPAFMDAPRAQVRAGELLVSWDAIPGATGYLVHVRGTQSGEKRLQTERLEMRVPGFLPGEQVKVRVQAVGVQGGRWSRAVSLRHQDGQATDEARHEDAQAQSEPHDEDERTPMPSLREGLSRLRERISQQRRMSLAERRARLESLRQARVAWAQVVDPDVTLGIGRAPLDSFAPMQRDVMRALTRAKAPEVFPSWVSFSTWVDRASADPKAMRRLTRRLASRRPVSQTARQVLSPSEFKTWKAARRARMRRRFDTAILPLRAVGDLFDRMWSPEQSKHSTERRKAKAAATRALINEGRALEGRIMAAHQAQAQIDAQRWMGEIARIARQAAISQDPHERDTARRAFHGRVG